MAKRGWSVVVSNHRGLGGVSITVSIDVETYESLISFLLMEVVALNVIEYTFKQVLLEFVK